MTFRRLAFRIGLMGGFLLLASTVASAQSSFEKCKAQLSAGGSLAGNFLTGGIGLTSIAGEFAGNFAADYLCSPDPDPETPPACQTDASSSQCQKAREQQNQAGPPPCLVKARALASACAANHGAATNACSDSQMPRSSQSGQQTSNSLQDSENYNAACNQARQFNETFQKELQQFASSCESAVTQCANACNELQSTAASCPSSQARQLAAQHQSQSASCQSGGSLASRPSQARGQANEAKNQLSQSTACAKESQAAQTPQNSQPSSNKASSVDTSGGTEAPGQMSNVSGDSSGSSATSSLNPTSSAVSRSNGTGGRIDTSGATQDDDQPLLHESSGGWSAGGSLAALPGTPAREPASDGGDSSQNTEQVASTPGTSGTYSGSGGKGSRLFLRPAGQTSMTAAEAGETPTDKTGTEIPDLSQFRPTGMAGLVRCTDSASAAALRAKSTSLQCVHSPHKDLFKAITERYERQVQDQKLYYDL